MNEKLFDIERTVGLMRKKAFDRYYHSGPPANDYAKGSNWAALATLDNVLSEFRLLIDGWGGSGHAQMAPQRARFSGFQGRCDTTMTERFANPDCDCQTYPGNLGPCRTYETGGNGRCVYCDHDAVCHQAVPAPVERPACKPTPECPSRHPESGDRCVLESGHEAPHRNTPDVRRFWGMPDTERAACLCGHPAEVIAHWGHDIGCPLLESSGERPAATHPENPDAPPHVFKAKMPHWLQDSHNDATCAECNMPSAHHNHTRGPR